CTGDSSSSPKPPPETSSAPTTTASPPVDLSFGVYGSPDEVAAYAAMANNFESVNNGAEVTVEHWRSHAELPRAVENGEPPPDVFLVSRRDLRWYLDNQLTMPVDTLLD